jgi:hypothetical protein
MAIQVRNLFGFPVGTTMTTPIAFSKYLIQSTTLWSGLAVLAAWAAIGASPARSAIIASHIGSNNPISENWTAAGGQTINTGPVNADLGHDAWHVATTGSAGEYPRYDYILTPANVSDMAAQGWTYSATLRNAFGPNQDSFGLPTVVSLTYRTGPDDSFPTYDFGIVISTDASGNPVIQNATVGSNNPLGPPIATPPLDNGYHTYQLIYDPNLAGHANDVQLLVDGSSLGFVANSGRYFGTATANYDVAMFNSASRTIQWDSYWSDVTLALGQQPVPEPTCILLCGSAMLMLCLGRGARTRRGIV